MRVVEVDVFLEVPYAELAGYDSNALSRYVIEKLRRGADDKAAEVRGRVLPDAVPQVVVSKRESLLLGGDWLLMAARWKVEVPESARLDP